MTSKHQINSKHIKIYQIKVLSKIVIQETENLKNNNFKSIVNIMYFREA